MKRDQKKNVNRKNWSLAKLIIIAEFEAKIFFNSANNIIGQLVIEPVAYIALLVAGLQGWNRVIQIDNGSFVDYSTFALPGILAMQLVRAFARVIYRVTVDRRWGLQALKFIAGTGIFAYIFGMTLMPVVIFLIQTVVSVIVISILGCQFTMTGLTIMTGLGMLVVIFWTCMAIIVTTAIKNYTQRDLVINLSLLPLMFSAPVLYPLNSAPNYIKMISFFNPLTYQVTAMRAAFTQSAFTSSLWVIVFLSLLSFLICALVLSRAELLSTEH